MVAQYALSNVIDCYVRNSTAFQIDNWRAEHQRERLPQICEQHGYQWEIWDEQGTSGESLEKRKKMQAILERIRTGKSAGIACVSFDRLSRDIDLVDGLVIWRTCKEAGAVIVTPDRVWRPGDDSDDDMGFIQFWLAGRNKRQQLDNLYEGMVKRAEAQPMLRGLPLHGYQRTYEPYVDSRGRQRVRAIVEVDPEVTKLTRYIFEQYPLRSTRKLATELNAKGPASWRKRWNKDGTATRVKWQVTAILRMVQNPLYKGVVIWGKDAKSKRVRDLLSPRQGRAFVHNVPELRIVDSATWAACQVEKEGHPGRFRRGHGVSPRTVGCNSIFGPLLKCPDCGSSLYYHTNYIYLKSGRRIEPSYICGRYHRQATCTSHKVREDEMLDLMRPIVADTLRRLDTEALAREELVREQAQDKRPGLEAELRTIQDAKEECRKDRYIKRIIGDADFQQFIQAFNDRQAEIEQELAAVDAIDTGGIESELAALHRWIGSDGVDNLVQTDNQEFWRLLMRRLFAGITIGYEARGSTRKARVWIDPEQCTLRPEVAVALVPQPAELYPSATPIEILG